MPVRALAAAACTLLLLLPAAALSTPTVTAAPVRIPLGETVVLDLSLNPDTIPVGAYSLKFSVSSVIALPIENLLLASVPICDQSKNGPDASGQFSVGGECVDDPLDSDTVVAHVTVTGGAEGGELWLDLSNVTDFDTFGDIALSPALLAYVTPEPATAAMLGLGILGLAAGCRGRSR